MTKQLHGKMAQLSAKQRNEIEEVRQNASSMPIFKQVTFQLQPTTPRLLILNYLGYYYCS